FSLFERRIGMGEDKSISMAMSKFGRLKYLPAIYLIHPANASTYFSNIKQFNTKVTYSRLFLALKYAELKNKPLIGIYSHFYYFISWRILIQFAKTLFKPSNYSNQALQGLIQGLTLTFTLPVKSKLLQKEI